MFRRMWLEAVGIVVQHRCLGDVANRVLAVTLRVALRHDVSRTQ